MSGADEIDAMIARLRDIAGAADRVADAAAVALRAEWEAQIARGEFPSGAPWPKTADGSQALQGAAKALSVDARGPVVVAQLRGHVALHHMGAARGGVLRQILPNRGIPPRLVAVLQRVAAEEWERVRDA